MTPKVHSYLSKLTPAFFAQDRPHSVHTHCRITQCGLSNDRFNLHDAPRRNHPSAASSNGVGTAVATINGLRPASFRSLSGLETLEGETCHILDRPTKKQLCLFYCKEAEERARRVAEDTDSVELRPSPWG